MNLVSVIIPCYNQGYFLTEAINSVLNQTYPHLEVVVVDDGSTDETPSIISAYCSRIRAVRQPNSGHVVARNVGLSISRGKYIAFLDADDWWHMEFISKMVDALESTGSGIAYCGWQNVGLPGNAGKPFIPPDYENTHRKKEHLIRTCPWPVHAAMVRRYIIESFGGFDVKWKTCEDFAFWIRAANSTRLVRVPEVLAFYRHHNLGQMTENREEIALNLWLVKLEYLRERPDIAMQLGRNRIRELTHGELLKNGFKFYWERDLPVSRKIFRVVMRTGYGKITDWKYMLPALLPVKLHCFLIEKFTSIEET